MNIRSLDRPPNAVDPLFWADFIELHTLIHPDHYFTRGDLDGISRRSKEVDSKKSFSVEDRWADLINFACVREIEYGSAYPFKVSDDKDALELHFEENNIEQHSYLSLLVAALLRHFPNQQNKITRLFEEISYHIFEKLMPDGSSVRPTWAHGGKQASYQGTLFRKMQTIAADLRCTANFKERDFKPTDTGDGGIDIISWHPMTDNRAGMPIAFAQCGCSATQWDSKQLEASPAKLHTKLPTMHPWSNYYFMPLDLRDADGGWAYESDLGQAIVVDRLRLIRLASEYNLHQNLPKLECLTEIMSAEYY